MARIALLCLALVALAVAQTTSPVDDLLTVTRSFQLTSPSDTQDRTTAQGVNFITGGEREVYIAGDVNAGNGCTSASSFPQSDVESGFWSVAQGRVCAAEFELRLDGSQGAADNSATRDLDLGLNLNAAGTGMRIDISSDLDYSFTIEIASSSGVSTVTRSIVGNPSLATEFEFEWSDFSGSADFNNVGAISLVFPGQINRDAEVSSWVLLAPNGGISGTVFEDCNCNGIQDAGDDPVPNAQITLSGTQGATTTTSANGQYSFSGLASGQYTVSVAGISTCSGSTSSTVTVAGDFPVVNFNAEIGGALIQCPADTQTTCGATSTATTGDAQIVTTCSGSGAGQISFSDSVSSVTCSGPGGQISTITRTFSSSAGTCTQRIDVFDTETLPILSIPIDFVTSDGSVCDSGAPTSTTGVASASNTCTPTDVSFTDSAAADCDAGSCTFAQEILRRWTAVDQCGNAAGAQTQRITCNGGTECPPCPTITIPNVSIPTVSIPSVPIDNPPTRNCRFICDDDDSSASILSLSAVAVLALIAMLF